MKYKTILCDPPWSYRNKRTGGSMKSGSSVKYPTLSSTELCDLPIQSIADKDCVLFLWVTVPLLPDGLDVLGAWGFEYKTTIFWQKVSSLGMGFWFRGQVELCLLGVRGKVKAFRSQSCNVIKSKARGHSRKPDEFYDLIEPVIPKPWVELFATRPRAGWVSTGLELDGTDVRQFLLR